jgi:hypothetical protein
MQARPYHAVHQKRYFAEGSKGMKLSAVLLRNAMQWVCRMGKLKSSKCIVPEAKVFEIRMQLQLKQERSVMYR